MIACLAVTTQQTPPEHLPPLQGATTKAAALALVPPAFYGVASLDHWPADVPAENSAEHLVCQPLELSAYLFPQPSS